MRAARTTRSRAAATAEKRERILDAALRCFVDRGYYGTSVPEVAKRAGIAAGSMYHHFDSKEALVNTLYRKWKGEIGRRVLAAFPGTAPPREQFRVMFRTMLEFALEHTDAFAFLELHNHGSYLDAESQAAENRLKDFGAGMVEHAQAQGAVRPGPAPLLMEFVFGAFIGMMRAHREGRTQLTPDEQLMAEEACWRLVAPDA